MLAAAIFIGLVLLIHSLLEKTFRNLANIFFDVVSLTCLNMCMWKHVCGT